MAGLCTASRSTAISPQRGGCTLPEIQPMSTSRPQLFGRGVDTAWTRRGFSGGCTPPSVGKLLWKERYSVGKLLWKYVHGFTNTSLRPIANTSHTRHRVACAPHKNVCIPSRRRLLTLARLSRQHVWQAFWPIVPRPVLTVAVHVRAVHFVGAPPLHVDRDVARE